MPKGEAMFRHLRPGLALLSATVALLVAGGSAPALAPPGTLEYEPSYFEGTTVVLQIPSDRIAPRALHLGAVARANTLLTAPSLFDRG